MTANKSGLLNAAAIDAIKSNDSNVKLLKQAVDSEKMIEVTTGPSVRGGGPKGVVGVPFMYQSITDQQAVVRAAGDESSLILEPSLYDGYTQTASESPSGNIRVTVADGTGATSTKPAAELAAATAHELYGHALPNAQGKPFQHEVKNGVYDPNGAVNKKIKGIEKHTKELNQ